MKRGSKPKFDNVLLKRWLLKVGPDRRKILLTKKIRNDRTKGQKSSTKDTQRPRDSNNNNSDLGNREFRRISSSSCHRENNKKERDKSSGIDSTEQPKCGTSGVANSSQRLTNSLKKVAETGESDRRCSEESRKSKSENGPRGKRKRRVPMQGDNRNGIAWRLVCFDMENPLKSPGPRLLQLRQADKQKKKDRLYAKFLEIFGEDIDPLESDISVPNNESHQTSNGMISKATVTPDRRTEAWETTETLNPKSPIFSNCGRKRRRENHALGGAKKLKTKNVNTEKDSVASDYTTNERGDTPSFREEINTTQDDTSTVNSTAFTDPLLGAQMTINTQNLAVGRSDIDFHTANSIIADPAAADKEKDSSFGDANKREKQPNLGLTSESDHEPTVTTDASSSSAETIPATRQQSVIVKLKKKHEEPVRVSSVESDPTPQLESVLNKKADFKQEAESKNSSVFDIGTSTGEAAANKILKTEPAEQFNPAATPASRFEWTLDALDDDPNPSSTTDTESSGMLGSAITCLSDRLLGALDNIYLALHCRRRVREREQTASKLAIQRNRQEEVLKAKHEFESKLIIFRDEICYLFKRLDTWDRVLRFIAQGLDHRTPAGIKPFSAAEVELAMLEVDVKVPFGRSENNPASVPKFQSVGRVLCTIDLTADNWEDEATTDHCDSSTDPPRLQNHLTIDTKFEPGVNGDDGSRKADLNANEIQLHSPSISEVKTISPQQFEKIGDKFESSSTGDDDPCYLCSRTSLVACSLCAKATYCSKDCQETHWVQSHYATCVPLKGMIHCQK